MRGPVHNHQFARKPVRHKNYVSRVSENCWSIFSFLTPEEKTYNFTLIRKKQFLCPTGLGRGKLEE